MRSRRARASTPARAGGPPRRRWGIAGTIVTGALVAATLLVGAPVAALPPSGAGSDTPGTSSTVSPRTLQACQTISFTVTGFPAGETVYVKIDDGIGYGDSSIQGAGVVAQQAIPASGTVNGSFELPCGITPGAHWLRFLATAYVNANDAGAGTIGYTNRGNSDFTVVTADGSSTSGGGSAGGTAGNGSSGGQNAAAPSAGTTVGSGAEQVGGAGGTLTIDPGAVAAEASATPSATPGATPSAMSSASVSAESDAAGAQPAAASIPWLGIGGLAVLLVVGAVTGWLVLRRRPSS